MQYTDREVEECQTLPLYVVSTTDNASSLGVAPYYMAAFEAGGVPTVTLVGTTTSNLSWQVRHRRSTTKLSSRRHRKADIGSSLDSSLILAVIDSNNTSGGTPAYFYTVVGAPT